MQTDTHTTQSLDNPGFDQMAQGLKSAMQEFSTTQSPEAIAMILSALKPIGDFSMRAWNYATSFVRRHPVQTAVGVVALGFIVAQLMKPARAPQSEDGRQY